MAGSGLLWLALTSCILTLASTSQHSDRIPRAAISHVQELSCGDPDTPGADDCFDPCENYIELDEPFRGTDTDSEEESQTCDDHLSGWYRFYSDGGIALPEKCIPMFHCQTDAPLWLNGAHPTKKDGIVNRTVCAHWVENCCFWHQNVQVKFCWDYSRYPDDPDPFYVYHLEATSNCNLGYCTDPDSTEIMCRHLECRSVERCGYVNKEWSCRCKKNYNDSEIQSLQPKLQCGASKITLTIDKCLLGGLETEEFIGLLLNGKTVDIEPGSDTDSRDVIIPFDSFDCPDTIEITEKVAVYKNTITFKSAETESILLQVNFDCTYPLEYGVSAPNVLRPLASRTSEATEGKTPTKSSSIRRFTPQMDTTANTGPGQSQEPGASSGAPVWVTATQALGPSSAAFPRALAGNQIRSVATEAQTSTFTGLQSSSPLSFNVSGEGKFSVTLGFYDADFKKPIEDPVIELPVDAIVHVEAKLEEGDRGHVKTLLRNCYATPDIYPIDYPLIQDSCPNPYDHYIYILKNGVYWKSRFEFQLFLLLEAPHVLYLRCEVYLCGCSEEPCGPICPERKGTDGTALGQTQETDLRSTTWKDVQTFAALSGAPRTAGFLMAWPALLLPAVLVWLF